MGLFFNRKDKSSENIGSGKVISFLNQKGGVGKTTMAFNTAFALKKKGHNVLCIDLDPQSNLSHLFGVDGENNYSIYNLLLNSVRELKGLHTSCLVSDLIVSKDGVDLLPASSDLSGFELTVAGAQTLRQLILRNFIDKNGLRSIYDTIIIDCPPTLGLLVINSLCASDGIIVPFRPDDFSRKGLEQLIDVLENIDDMGVVKVPEVIAHVPNLVDQRRKQERLDLESIQEFLGDEATIVGPFYNRGQLVKALGQRKSVYDYNAKEFLPIKESFNELAEKIAEFSK